MSKINRRGFFGVSAGLASLLGFGGQVQPQPSPAYPPACDAMPETTTLATPKLDPFYKFRRIKELNRRLATLQRDHVYMQQKNLHVLKSVSPNAKYLIETRWMMERRHASYVRDIINELYHLGDHSHGTPDTSGPDLNPGPAAEGQTAIPY